MSLLWVADSFYVGSRDVAAATSWYVEKFGLKKTEVELDEGEGCMGLIFPKELPTPIVIGPITSRADAATRMLYSGNLEKARKLLGSRGVNMGPTETDRQGTRFFSVRDLDGNVIEISDEPWRKLIEQCLPFQSESNFCGLAAELIKRRLQISPDGRRFSSLNIAARHQIDKLPVAQNPN